MPNDFKSPTCLETVKPARGAATTGVVPALTSGGNSGDSGAPATGPTPSPLNPKKAAKPPKAKTHIQEAKAATQLLNLCTEIHKKKRNLSTQSAFAMKYTAGT